MVRAVARSAASALCLIWAAGCASTNEPAPKTAAAPPVAKAADVEPDASSDIATLTKNLPTTLEGEIRRAELLRSKGDYDEAARSLAQILLIAPDDARVVGAYGKVLEQQGRSQDALAFLKRAVELDPHAWSLQSSLGVAYDQLDDHVSARAAYNRALALKPGDASVLNNLAVSRMLAGDYAGAQRLFAEAAARGAPNPKMVLNLQKLAALKPEAATPVAVARPVPDKMARPAVPLVVLARPAVVTASAQKTVTQGLTAKNHTPAATAAPKSLAPQVVMERVPVDPLAGPVARARPTAPKLASAAHPVQKPVAQKPVAPTPSLRTAADAN
ncbi:MAG TPA: tetratricopeptide repeat protein [Rhizomicrobium sp.]